MVQLGCDSKERYGIEINSYKLFEELKDFFEEQIRKGVFNDIPVTEPFHVGYSQDPVRNGSKPSHIYPSRNGGNSHSGIN